MMEDGYGKHKEKHNIEKSGVVGHRDLPGGRWAEEEEVIM